MDQGKGSLLNYGKKRKANNNMQRQSLTTFHQENNAQPISEE